MNDIESTFNKYNLKLLGNKNGNSKTKFTAVDKEGYLVYISLEFLKTNNGSYRLWHKSNPYSIYNINKYLKDHNINTQTISEEYKSLADKMKWLCEDCGCIYECRFGHIKTYKMSKCRKCSIDNQANIRRIDMSDLKKFFVDKGYQPMFEKIENKHQSVPLKNKKGYIVFSNYYNIKNGSEGKIIDSKNPYSINNIQKYIIDNNIKCKLISNTYINASTNMIFECECGRHFKTTWASFLSNRKHRCDICGKRRSRGELKVEEWLSNNGLEFENEYRLDGCKYKRLLPFDIAVFKSDTLKGLIEIDGLQHFEEVLYFGGKKNFERQKKVDLIKNKFCENNNIPLLRIPYWEFKNNNYIKILKQFKNSII